MHVSLGTFAATSLAALYGGQLTVGVEQALRYYCRRLESAQPLPIPRFAASGERAERLSVSLDAALEARLAREGARQGVELEELLGHAVLIYLADLDAGRAG